MYPLIVRLYGRFHSPKDTFYHSKGHEGEASCYCSYSTQNRAHSCYHKIILGPHLTIPNTVLEYCHQALVTKSNILGWKEKKVYKRRTPTSATIMLLRVS